MSVLDTAGPQAGSIADVWDIFVAVAVVVFAIVVGFYVIAAVIAVRRRHDPIDDTARERSMIRKVIAASGVTVAILVGLLVASIRTGDALNALEDDRDALQVRITAHQWWWQADYNRNDPMHAATTANEIHVPVGRTVQLELTSQDVIHSFWVPSLHGKRDAIPGRINKMFVRVDEPGVFRGQCAEFCGVEHARMILTVIAEPADVFDSWLATQRASARSPDDDLAKRG